MIKPSLLFALAVVPLLLPSSLRAAANALDSANNYTGMTYYDRVNLGSPGFSNPGYGFGTGFTTNPSRDTQTISPNASRSAKLGSSPAINSANGLAFGLHCAPGGMFALADRPLGVGANGSNFLAPGQILSLDLQCGVLPTTGYIDLVLQGNSIVPTPSGGGSYQRFRFLAGSGQPNYVYSTDGTTYFDTGIPFTAAGLTLSFAQDVSNQFVFTIALAGSPVSLGTYTGVLALSDINRVVVSESEAATMAAGDLYFNNVRIVPEPRTWMILAMLSFGFALRRLVCRRTA